MKIYITHIKPASQTEMDKAVSCKPEISTKPHGLGGKLNNAEAAQQTTQKNYCSETEMNVGQLRGLKSDCEPILETFCSVSLTAYSCKAKTSQFQGFIRRTSRRYALILDFFFFQIIEELIFSVSIKLILLLSQLWRPFFSPPLPPSCMQITSSLLTERESCVGNAKRDVLVFSLFLTMRFSLGRHWM